MNKELLKPGDIITWNCGERNPIGVYESYAWFHAAIHFVAGEPDRVWWEDAIETDENTGEVDWDKVRFANAEERKQLLVELGDSYIYEHMQKQEGYRTAVDAWGHVAERYEKNKPKLADFLREEKEILMDEGFRATIIVKPQNAEQHRFLNAHAEELNELFSALMTGTPFAGGYVLVAHPEVNPLPF